MRDQIEQLRDALNEARTAFANYVRNTADTHSDPNEWQAIYLMEHGYHVQAPREDN